MVLSLSVRWQEAMAKGIFEKKKLVYFFAIATCVNSLFFVSRVGYYYDNIFLGIKAARYGIEFIATIVISVPEMENKKNVGINVKSSVANGAAIHVYINAGLKSQRVSNKIETDFYFWKYT